MRALVFAGACAVTLLFASTAHAEIRNVTATLSGAAVAPGPGDPTASGTFLMWTDVPRRTLCVHARLTGVRDVPEVALVRAAPGGTGRVVLGDLELGNGIGCTLVTSDSLVRTLREIATTPERFAVQVSTDTFPRGAIRGQLAADSMARFRAGLQFVVAGDSVRAMMGSRRDSTLYFSTACNAPCRITLRGRAYARRVGAKRLPALDSVDRPKVAGASHDFKHRYPLAALNRSLKRYGKIAWRFKLEARNPETGAVVRQEMRYTVNRYVPE